MKRVLTKLPEELPQAIMPYAQQAIIYDSSCSVRAQVYFLDKDAGFYLKKSEKGTLKKEAEMYNFFHRKGLAPEVIAYESGDYDWMLTRRVPGEDCIWQPYLDDPKRLCDTTARLLRQLHETDTQGCPISNRTADYISGAEKNYRAGIFDADYLPEKYKHLTDREVWQIAEQVSKEMKADTLLHGDYCLPNIILDNWEFSGFIDLDGSGIGDRHIDLFWGVWTLEFNLKTDRYAQRFLDAYGRDMVNEDLLSAIGCLEAFG